MMIKPTTLWGVMTVAVISATVIWWGMQTTITLSENGEEREIKTFASTVEDLLEKEQILLSEHDYLSVPLGAPLVHDMKIRYKKAKHIVMMQDGNKKELWTTANTIGELLDEKRIRHKEQDYLSMPLETSIEDNVAFVFKTGKQVVFRDGVNEETTVWTVQDTWESFLREQQLQLSELDRVEAPKGTIHNGQSISIIRVEKKEVEETKDVLYAIVTKKDNNLLTGKKQVITKGENGQRMARYAVLYENGEEIQRTFLEDKVIKEPKNEVVAVGNKTFVATVSRGNTDKPRGKEFYVTATAYTAYCNGCSGKTATGFNLRTNPSAKVIAVDPAVIPLGTKVWVEGYGYAVAADKGGAIKGHKIDVFLAEKEQMRQWGRKKVKIRIL